MRKVHVLVLAAVAAAMVLVVQVGAAPGKSVALSPIGTYASGVPFDGDFGAAEVPAYDAGTQRVFVVNGQQQKIDVLDISTPSAPSLIGSIDLELRPNSVSAHAGLVAVALEADTKTDAGRVAFYPAACVPASCPLLNEVEVGALPDMATFSPSGRYVLVANEGEPETQNGTVVDPKGTVSVIDLRNGVDAPIVDTVDFTSLDGRPVPAGVVLAPGRKPSLDFEPEYVTVSTNSQRAWVALQEANAIAEIDVANAELVAVRGLGFKDHGLARNSLDVSDREASLDGANRGVVNMCAWANVYGVYQPDAIAAYQVRNRFYVVSANEGDSRDENNPFTDEARVGALTSSFTGSPFTSLLRANRNLGRLTVNRNLGVVEGVQQQLYAYGARSFSIWRDDGVQVYDSGNELERIVGSFPAPTQATDPYEAPLVLVGASVPPSRTESCPVASTITDPSKILPLTTPANSNHEEGPSFDNRSDNKGPEPEAVAVGKIRGQTYAFVGLERAGGIAVYNVTDPTAATFVQYVNPRDFTAGPYLTEGDESTGNWEDAGDLGPEGVVFISEDDSPTGAPLLVVANEVSGTTTIYAIANT